MRAHHAQFQFQVSIFYNCNRGGFTTGSRSGRYAGQMYIPVMNKIGSDNFVKSLFPGDENGNQFGNIHCATTAKANDGYDLSARGGMLLASHYGGMCLGPVNTAAVHALAYPLGGEFHVPHGVANSLLLPHVCRFNLPSATGRYVDVAKALGVINQGTPESIAIAGIREIERLSESCGIARRLSQLNIGRNAIPKMAAAAMTVTRLLERNPRTVRERDVVAIYEAAL